MVQRFIWKLTLAVALQLLHWLLLLSQLVPVSCTLYASMGSSVMTEEMYQHFLMGKRLTCGMQGLSICAEEVWNGQAAMKEGIAQTQVLALKLLFMCLCSACHCQVENGSYTTGCAKQVQEQLLMHNITPRRSSDSAAT